MISKSLFRFLVAVSLTAVPFAAQAEVIHFQATLSPESEVPTPNIPDGFDPTGHSVGWYDTDSNELSVSVHWQGLTTPASAAHLHNGVPTGGVFIGFPDFPALATGVYSRNFTLSDAQESTFLSGFEARTLYVNVHSDLNPKGEIRGFLQPVPEPETYALLAMGLFGTWAARRRGQRR